MALRTSLARAELHAKALMLRGLLGLPRGVQRRLAGRPLSFDGPALAVDTQLMLRLSRILREPSTEDLPVPAGRRLLLEHATIVGGSQPIGEVRDVAVGDLAGRLYVPAGLLDPGPLLLFFHGGGWVYGDLDSHDAPCRFLAEHSGVRVLAVDYRRAPEHPFPAAVDDAWTAYAWVVENAERVGAESTRLAVGGDSVGGNLAAVTALEAAVRGWPLALQLLVYPGTDASRTRPSRRLFGTGLYLTEAFLDVVAGLYLSDASRRTDPRVSPMLAEVPPGLAPAYVATAGFDPLRDEGEAYAHKLREAGVDVQVRRFDDQIHGFLNIVGVGWSARAASAEIAARLSLLR